MPGWLTAVVGLLGAMGIGTVLGQWINAGAAKRRAADAREHDLALQAQRLQYDAWLNGRQERLKQHIALHEAVEQWFAACRDHAIGRKCGNPCTVDESVDAVQAASRQSQAVAWTDDVMQEAAALSNACESSFFIIHGPSDESYHAYRAAVDEARDRVKAARTSFVAAFRAAEYADGPPDRSIAPAD